MKSHQTTTMSSPSSAVHYARRFTDAQIAQILRLHESGNYTHAEIADIVAVPPRRIHLFLWRHFQGQGLPPKPILRHRITDGTTGLQIKKLVQGNPKGSLRDIPGQLKAANDAIGVEAAIPSKTTVHRYLQRNGFVMQKLIKAPMVSDKNKARRLEFASRFSANPDTWWRHILWSDETSVQAHPKGRDVYVRVHGSVKRENLPRNVQVQAGGFSVMFWGCFSAFGFGPLVVCPKSMDSKAYLQIIKESVLPHVERVKAEHQANLVFMQDNAPCHKAKVVMDFLASEHVETLDWPPQSPDMNPIENLWGIIKAKRQKDCDTPRTKKDLIDQVYSIWNSLEPKLAHDLAESAVRRMQLVVEAKGWSIKY
jgi:transposase